MPIAYSVRKVYKPLTLINVHLYRSLTSSKYYYKKRDDVVLRKLSTDNINLILRQLLLNKG